MTPDRATSLLQAIAPPLPEALLRELCALGEVYIVGGCVRDALLELAHVDADVLVRGIELHALETLVRKYGHCEEVGRSFGVLKVTPRGWRTVDVTLPRTERSTGPAHRDFDVDADPALPVEEDLARRDFTINAMAWRWPSGPLVDPFGGLADLAARTLRMLGAHTFPDDPLRILRGVQFAARFDLACDPATFDAMREHAPRVTTVAPERIADEIAKLLTQAREPSIGWRLMQDTGVLEVLFPEFAAMVGVTQEGTGHAWDVWNHTLRCVDVARPELSVRWAAMLHDVGKPPTRAMKGDRATFYGHDYKSVLLSKRILGRLRSSNELIADVGALVENHMFTTAVSDKGLRRLMRRVGVERVDRLLDLREADAIAQAPGQTASDIEAFRQRIRDELAKVPPLSIRDLALGGGDLMREFAWRPGPNIGKTLDYLFERVIDEPALNTRAALLTLAREFIANDMRPVEGPESLPGDDA